MPDDRQQLEGEEGLSLPHARCAADEQRPASTRGAGGARGPAWRTCSWQRRHTLLDCRSLVGVPDVQPCRDCVPDCRCSIIVVPQCWAVRPHQRAWLRRGSGRRSFPSTRHAAARLRAILACSAARARASRWGWTRWWSGQPICPSSRPRGTSQARPRRFNRPDMDAETLPGTGDHLKWKLGATSRLWVSLPSRPRWSLKRQLPHLADNHADGPILHVISTAGF